MKDAIERIFISHTSIYFQLKLFIQIETLSYDNIHIHMILKLLRGNFFYCGNRTKFKKTLEDSDKSEKIKVQCIHSFVFKFKQGAHV